MRHCSQNRKCPAGICSWTAVSYWLASWGATRENQATGACWTGGQDIWCIEISFLMLVCCYKNTSQRNIDTISCPIHNEYTTLFYFSVFVLGAWLDFPQLHEFLSAPDPHCCKYHYCLVFCVVRATDSPFHRLLHPLQPERKCPNFDLLLWTRCSFPNQDKSPIIWVRRRVFQNSRSQGFALHL